MGKNWKIKTNDKESRQIVKKKREYNEALFQLFIDFKKALIHLREMSCKIISLSLEST